jgi:hypothetical protein
MNSFKTLGRERVGPTVAKKIDIEYVNEPSNFPVLSCAAVLNEAVNVLDYKKATKHEIVHVPVVDLNYVAPGWVKYAVDKKTKRIVETMGAVEPETVLNPEEKNEQVFDELISALNTNWVRNRNSFIECHGEDYYNDTFLMEYYDEMSSDGE